MTNPTETASATSPVPAASLPLFYRAPGLLRFQDHARLGLRRGPAFGFAAGATAIPVVAGEFALAGRDYPLVFASDEAAMPLAVTGLAAGQNLFVEADGQWRAGCYIPGYARRYPFIGMTVAEGGATLLGADLASDRLASDRLAAGDEEAELLFDAKGGPTPAGQAAIALCEAYAADHERTRAFAQALKANGLLAARTAQVNYEDAGRAVVQGFQLVDDAAFRALPGPVLAEFHAKGWLDLIVLHLASQQRWRALAAEAAKTRTQARNPED
ncbi:SapC family protein [Ancylobacter sp. FA202]|uniref:SapC family protein n=1 Tax=Ancylobacter sp. FA202 TaxID=1111106 RepID=UPI000366B2E7|nr:SapC family protein [Ancylobacter sp. FA202]